MNRLSEHVARRLRRGALGALLLLLVGALIALAGCLPNGG